MTSSSPTGIPFGRYRRGRRIATGGMGEVFVARQLGLGDFDKPIALKLMLPDLAETPSAVQMFLDEARIAARMTHPNIVQIHDVGVELGRYYIAMELVRGVSLATLIRALTAAGRTLPAGALLWVAHALCGALHHAHEQTDGTGRPLNLVHRDVTPHNILVSAEGEVKLADFGIARVAHAPQRTQTGSVKGKLEYLAPEQLRNEPADRQSDLYSAGITLFQLATLRSPFRRDNDGATVRAIELDPLPSLRTLRPDLPEQLVEAIERATQRERTSRFSTAREMAAMLPPASIDDAGYLGRCIRELCPQALEILENAFAAPPDAVPALATGSIPFSSESRSLDGGPALTASNKRRTLRIVALGAACALTAIAVAAVRWPTPGPGARAATASAKQTVSGAAPLVPSVRSVDEARAAPTALHLPSAGHGVETRAPPAAALLPSVRHGDEAHVAPAASLVPSARQGGEARAVAAPTLTSLQRDDGDAKIDAVGPEEQTRTRRPPRTRSARPSVRKVTTEPATARTVELGYLAIDALPWAQVTVAGKKVGETPIGEYPVKKGRVAVVLRCPDTGKRWTKTVNVEPGKSTRVWADLR